MAAHIRSVSTEFGHYVFYLVEELDWVVSCGASPVLGRNPLDVSVLF